MSVDDQLDIYCTMDQDLHNDDSQPNIRMKNFQTKFKPSIQNTQENNFREKLLFDFKLISASNESVEKLQPREGECNRGRNSAISQKSLMNPYYKWANQIMGSDQSWSHLEQKHRKIENPIVQRNKSQKKITKPLNEIPQQPLR